MIIEKNLGVVADFGDIDVIAISILKVYKMWENKEVLTSINPEQLHRKYHLEKLDQLIQKLIDEKSDINRRTGGGIMFLII